MQGEPIATRKGVRQVHIRLFKHENGTYTILWRKTRQGEGRSHVKSGVTPGTLREALESGVQEMRPLKQLEFPQGNQETT